MKLRLKCPACSYKFIVNARLSSDSGEATCPLSDCKKVFPWRGPDAPLNKNTGTEGAELFEQLFGKTNPFNDLVNGKK